MQSSTYSIHKGKYCVLQVNNPASTEGSIEMDGLQLPIDSAAIMGPYTFAGCVQGGQCTDALYTSLLEQMQSELSWANQLSINLHYN